MDLLDEEDVIGPYSVINDLLSSSSEEEQSSRAPGGSCPGKAPNLNRNHEATTQRLRRQYFDDDCLYVDDAFRRRFRISRPIFERIFEEVKQHDTFFQERRDCTGRMGISALLKVTAALRILAYGLPPDAMDDYLSMSETTARDSLFHFCTALIDRLGPIYLRSPTPDDIKEILSLNAARGFPGLLGSIDCCKWEWKNCPTAWHGQFRGKEKKPTVTLEAICDRRLWIWHAFFGMPGCLNDINVVEASPLLEKISSGVFPPPCEFRLAGTRRNKPYWFADGIYPKAPFFMSSIQEPSSNKEKLYAKIQEAVRKDIERAFGVLQGKWNILSQPSKFMTVENMEYIVKATVIMHNMCVEERGDDVIEDVSDDDDSIIVGGGVTPMWAGLVRLSGQSVVAAAPGSISAMCEMIRFMEDEQECNTTKLLLVQHLWDRFGDSPDGSAAP